jgi:hypothetical protein
MPSKLLNLLILGAQVLFWGHHNLSWCTL